MEVNLVLFKKNGSRKTFSLPSSVTVIGRRSNCDLHVPLTAVSRKHCQLHRDKGVFKIRDLGSRNGTYLNGKRIEESAVRAGDRIKVGPLTFVLQIGGQPRNINIPGSAAGRPAQEDVLADDSGTFADLGDLDSLEETGHT
jgi:pSer/pThr/pTyr-binding forkhead associated (FHA) protein